MKRTILFFAFMLIATGAKGNDSAGIYTLAAVDGAKIPGTVSHGGHDMMLYLGVFTINADGTCVSQTVFGAPSGEKITRQVNATYTQDGSTLNMQWEGAGRTTGVIEGETFTMNNEGMIFSYTKQSAPPPEVAIKETVVSKRDINGNFQGETYDHASGVAMPLHWDGSGGAFALGQLGERLRHAGTPRNPQRHHSGSGLDKQRVDVTVVAAFDFDDLISAGTPASKPDRGHRRLGAGRHETDFLTCGDPLANHLGQSGFQLTGGTEGGPQ